MNPELLPGSSSDLNTNSGLGGLKKFFGSLFSGSAGSKSSPTASSAGSPRAAADKDIDDGLPSDLPEELKRLLGRGGLLGGFPGMPSMITITRGGSIGMGGPSDDRHPLDSGRDPNDNRPNLLIAQNLRIEPEQSSVKIDYNPEHWFSFHKTGKICPIPSGMMPLKPLAFSPRNLCKNIQGQEVSLSVVGSTSIQGTSGISIDLPWKPKHEGEPSAFSLTSQKDALASIDPEIKRINHELPDHISVDLDQSTQTIDFSFNPNGVADQNLKEDFATYIKLVAATIDYLNRLTNTPTPQPQIILESPPLREGTGRSEESVDINKLLIKSRPTDRLIDLGGSPKLKAQLEEVILFFRNPEHFKSYGVTKLGNVILHGPAGGGKTLSARILAGELDLPFYEVKISDLLSAWYGVSEKNVRAIFDGVQGPCLLFFDEMDAIGRNRDHSDSVSSRVLNEILAQIDGLNSRKDILIVGATNKLDILDPALTRPGRFSHKILVPRPDHEGRVEVFKIHHRKVCSTVSDPSILMAKDIDFDRLASETDTFVGDEIREILTRGQMTVARQRLKDPSDKVIITTDLLLQEIRDYEEERTKIDTERRKIGFAEIDGVRAREPRLRKVGQ